MKDAENKNCSPQNEKSGSEEHLINTSILIKSRVARWYIFIPKSQCGYIGKEGPGMENVGLFYGQLKYFTAIR
jgi:hypothetical protein